ncbi:hypothetical protein [Spirosoma areae]
MADNENQPEAIIESLQAQLADEQAAHGATIETQKETLESLQAQLVNERNAHEATKLEATQVIEGQKEAIDELERRIVEMQTSPAAFPVIEVGKVKYEVQVKSFKYKGETYTVEQLIANKVLQKELVGKGVGFLIKKEG